MKARCLGILFASAAALSGCATVELAQGPSIAAIQPRDGQPAVQVPMTEDTRKSSQIGTIGAAIMHTPPTVKGMVHNYLVNTLHDSFKISVKPGSEGSGGKSVTSTIVSIGMYSVDAILQPVSTHIELALTVNDAQGQRLYERLYRGEYSERIGVTFGETKTGQCVEDAIRNVMQQIAGDGKLKKVLES